MVGDKPYDLTVLTRPHGFNKKAHGPQPMGMMDFYL
jgi:hypothetical protein